MSTQLKSIHTHAFDFWLARGSVIVIAALQLSVINKLSVGPYWLAPALELALLLPLSLATAWTQGKARDATTDHHWYLIARQRRRIRALAVGLTALVTAMNCGALYLLVRELLLGNGSASGLTLLLDAANIWGTNMIAFALWYWSIDRGGPAARGIARSDAPDFLFPQMTLDDAKADWSAGFVDYLYLSFTNATAVIPMPRLPGCTKPRGRR